MELTPADLAALPQDWTREQFDEMLDRIRIAHAVKYWRIMRPRAERDLSKFITGTNIAECWNGEDRRTRNRQGA